MAIIHDRIRAQWGPQQTPREYHGNPLPVSEVGVRPPRSHRGARPDGWVRSALIVEWIADGPVSDPIVHSVTIGTTSQQGISFLGGGVVPESR